MQNDLPLTDSAEMTFFPGLHQPADCRHVDQLPRAFVSVNRLRDRKSDFVVGDWIMDSGAFTELTRHGQHRLSVDEYAAQIARWSRCGNLLAACTQDYMCEDIALAATEHARAADFEGEMAIWDHQCATVDRFGDLVAAVRALGCSTYVMPALQGFAVSDYLTCLELYEDAGHLPTGAWVGVGSVCKRNADPQAIVEILTAIKERRPDLKLHGFGLKVTALEDPRVRALLATSDSMAWSDAARKMRNRIRKAGGDWKAAPSPNDYRVAVEYKERVEDLIAGGQLQLDLAA